MDVSTAILNRYSVRGFKPDRVDQTIINKIFETARWAPSNCNIQSWHVNVVSGEAKDKLAEALIADVMSGKKEYPDFVPGNSLLTGAHKERQYECAARYYATMGIERSDKRARMELSLKNWAFFDAPHVAFISVPKYMRDGHFMDVGIYLQTLMLLMVEHGLGSVAQGALSLFPDPAKMHLDIPEDHGIIVGLSFGYPEEGAQINKARMDRDPMESHVFFSE